MTKKVTGSDLEKLIKEALLSENNNIIGRSLKTYSTNRDDKWYQKKGSPNLNDIKKFLKLIGLNDEATLLQKAVRRIALHDNDGENISAADLKAAYDGNNANEKIVMNAIAYFILKSYAASKAIQKFNKYDMSTTDKEKYKTSKFGIDKGAKEISIDTEFKVGDETITPGWFNSSGGKDLTPGAFASLAAVESPDDELDNKDFVKVLQEPTHPQHYWAVDFIENALVLFDQKKLPGIATGGPYGSILKKALLAFRNISPKIDPDDKALGRDKVIPNVPIQSRYGSRVGHSTPETLQRIFNNLGVPLTDSVGPKFQQIKDAVKEIKDNSGSLAIEKTFSNVMVYDYLVRIIQDYESSAAGFLFENFLAFLTAGTKEGGNLKIEDFSYTTTNDKERLASAKLYRAGTTKFKGSAKLFYNAAIRSSLKSKSSAQVKVVYVLAMKGQNLENVTVRSRQVYLKRIRSGSTEEIEVRLDGPNSDIYDKVVSTSDGKFKSKTTGESQLEFPWPTTGAAYTIDFTGIASDRTQYEDTIKTAMNNTKEKLGEMFAALNNIQVNSTKYFSILQGNEPAEKLDSFEESLDSIKTFRSAAENTFKETAIATAAITDKGAASAKVADTITGALEESKITPDALKKIIEESFKR